MEFCAHENSGGSSQNQEEKYERRALTVEKIQQRSQIIQRDEEKGSYRSWVDFRKESISLIFLKLSKSKYVHIF